MAKAKPLPSKEYLHECFTYDNGKLFWKHRPQTHFPRVSEYRRWNNIFAGKEAGSRHNQSRGQQPRWRVSISDASFNRYRVIWAMFHGFAPDIIDHKNMDSLDDRVENLREATASQNVRNAKLAKNNTSGHRGVYWNSTIKKWHVLISFSMGSYDNLEDAVAARAEGVKKYYGEFTGAG
jgi:hypothetical protein